MVWSKLLMHERRRGEEPGEGEGLPGSYPASLSMYGQVGRTLWRVRKVEGVRILLMTNRRMNLQK